MTCSSEIENNPSYQSIKSLIQLKEKNYKEALFSSKLAIEKLSK